MTTMEVVELPLTLGRRIAEARRQAHLSQKVAAREAGIHRNTLSRYENDVDVPDFAFMVWLARRSGWSLAAFAGAIPTDPTSPAGGPISGESVSPCTRSPLATVHRIAA